MHLICRPGTKWVWSGYWIQLNKGTGQRLINSQFSLALCVPNKDIWEPTHWEKQEVGFTMFHFSKCMQEVTTELQLLYVRNKSWLSSPCNLGGTEGRVSWSENWLLKLELSHWDKCVCIYAALTRTHTHTPRFNPRLGSHPFKKSFGWHPYKEILDLVTWGGRMRCSGHVTSLRKWMNFTF